jgi:hypothetical protein
VPFFGPTAADNFLEEGFTNNLVSGIKTRRSEFVPGKDLLYLMNQFAHAETPD